MPQEVVVLILGGMAFSMAWGILRAIKSIALKRMELKKAPEPERPDIALNALHHRMEALEEGLYARLQDLEERMDFTERVLARGRQDRQPTAD